ncbi:MAG: hypothetical protein ABI910_00945 [Gemmatimonadota bacterium]
MTTHLMPDAAPLPETGEGASACTVDTLTRADRAELFALLDRHFEGVEPAQFARDLDEKDWVLRVRRDGRLVGFTTLQLYDTPSDEGRLHVIYSGDTIVAPEAWGSPVLARGWIALVRALQATRPTERWVWLLLSSGFRTYRFLPVFWRAFAPHYAGTSPDVAAMLARLARERFGAAFNEATGVVRFAHPQRLRGSLCSVPDGREDDPHVRFFLARNPGHAAGDELVCLTTLSDDNLTTAGARMVRAGPR